MAPARPARPSVVREFAAGFATLGRGFGFWQVRPRIMALGLIPAGIVAAVIVAGVVVLVVNLVPVTAWLTPFAAEWDPAWRDLLRVLLGVALVVATLALAARTFTAVTLLIGGPFYDRIQEAADEAEGDLGTGTPLGFWPSIGATIVLILQSLLASLVVLLVGLIPGIGSVTAAVFGFVLTAFGLSRELTLNPLARRGLDGAARAALRRGHRARRLGFGIAVNLCFLVPLGAIVAMPAAVAGSAYLARDLARGLPPTVPPTTPPRFPTAPPAGPSGVLGSGPSGSGA